MSLKKTIKKIIIDIVLLPIIVFALMISARLFTDNAVIKKNYSDEYISKVFSSSQNKEFSGISWFQGSKKETLKASSDIKLIPGGQPIGVKLNTDGILVVGFSDIDTPSGKKMSPAAASGIQIGDLIIDIESTKIESTTQLSETINKYGSKEISIKIKRSDNYHTVKVKPVYNSANKESKIGLWVRDSAAGVGTLTFYDPSTGKFGALGHPINDMDTGSIIKIKDGSIYNAKIISIEQGKKGKPGELRGIFSEDDGIGKIQKNTSQGIYGNLTGEFKNSDRNKAYSIARRNEIKEGPAKIFTCIDDNEVKEYDISIEKTFTQNKPSSKSMIIKITDKDLLSKTGGIVQGMSGSPIVQNNKIVGAVTHVFVNRPDMGYGIYIEWMLDELGYEI